MISIPRVGPGLEFAPIPVRRGDRVFILTGAGISAESGVRTFRDANGLWEEHDIQDVATPEGFARDPGLVWRFYSERRRQVSQVHPNPAHLALARLEEALGDGLFLCTQNVDPLHERAGSRHVTHMHGELCKTRCERDCANTPAFDDGGFYLDPKDLPRCPCGGMLRPHVCWFGEIPYEMERIGEALSACDLFVTIGSSGAVHPAAGFASHVRHVPSRLTGRHARTIYLGLEKPDNSHCFDECRLGKAGELVPGLFEIQ